MCVALKISATFVSRNQRGVRSDKRQATSDNQQTTIKLWTKQNCMQAFALWQASL